MEKPGSRATDPTMSKPHSKKLAFDPTGIQKEAGLILTGFNTASGAPPPCLNVTVDPQEHANAIATHTMELSLDLRAGPFLAKMVQLMSSLIARNKNSLQAIRLARLATIVFCDV